MAVSVFPAPTIDTSAPPGAIEKISTYALNGSEAFMDIAVPSAGRYAVRYTGPERYVGMGIGWEPRKHTGGVVASGQWAFLPASEAGLRLRVGGAFHTDSTEPRYENTTAHLMTYRDAAYRSTAPFSGLNAAIFFPAANLYIIGNSSGQIATSPDGFTWTTRTNVTSQYLYGFTYSSNRIVAYHTGGAIAYSSNGINWTLASSPTNQSIIDGMYINGQFLLVAASGISLRSTDGITWTANPQQPTGWNMVCVTRHGSRYVAAVEANQSDGARVYLTDNPSAGWSIGGAPRWSPGSTNTLSTQGVVSTFNGFVISTNLGNSFKSPNGFDWDGTRMYDSFNMSATMLFGQVLHKAQSSSIFYVEGINGENSFTRVNTGKAGGFDFYRQCEIAEGPVGLLGRTLMLSLGSSVIDIYYRKTITGVVEVYRVA